MRHLAGYPTTNRTISRYGDTDGLASQSDPASNGGPGFLEAFQAVKAWTDKPITQADASFVASLNGGPAWARQPASNSVGVFLRGYAAATAALRTFVWKQAVAGGHDTTQALSALGQWRSYLSTHAWGLVQLQSYCAAMAYWQAGVNAVYWTGIGLVTATLADLVASARSQGFPTSKTSSASGMRQTYRAVASAFKKQGAPAASEYLLALANQPIPADRSGLTIPGTNEQTGSPVDWFTRAVWQKLSTGGKVAVVVGAGGAALLLLRPYAKLAEDLIPDRG